MIEELERFRDKRQESEENAMVERYSIPDKDALNRILKYQAPERPPAASAPSPSSSGCSGSARGDYVPPPVKVSVDGPLGGE
jgi:hypothetical protein